MAENLVTPETQINRTRRAIMPAEWLVAVVALFIVALYQHFRIPMPGQPGDVAGKGPLLFYLKQLYASFYLYALMFVGITVWTGVAECRCSLSRSVLETTKAVFGKLGTRFQPSECLLDARLFHCVVVMFVEFQLLKHLIPHVNGAVFDAEFAYVDRLVCGDLCGVYLHSLLGSGAAAAASAHYTWYFPYMIGAVLVVLATATRRTQHEFIFAFMSLFFIGIVWVYLLPTWGPAFYAPEQFGFMKGTDSGLLQSDLWAMREVLVKDPTTPGVIFTISGFPSLHVAVVLLGTVYARKIHPWLGLLSWSFFILIVHSTIILGWHYVLDDVGSVLLVGCGMWGARRFGWGSD